MKYVLGFLFVVLAPCATFGQILSGTPLVRFNGGIGVIPGTTNTVRGVAPAGQIWVISNLRAVVNTDGNISVLGLGLLLGGAIHHRNAPVGRVLRHALLRASRQCHRLQFVWSGSDGGWSLCH